MGAIGDAGQLNIGSAPDFLFGINARVGQLLEGVDSDLVNLWTDPAHLISGDGDNFAPIRDHLSRFGFVHLTQVGAAVPARGNVEDLPFGPVVKLCAVGASALVLPHQIACGRTGPLR